MAALTALTKQMYITLLLEILTGDVASQNSTAAPATGLAVTKAITGRALTQPCGLLETLCALSYMVFRKDHSLSTSVDQVQSSS